MYLIYLNKNIKSMIVNIFCMMVYRGIIHNSTCIIHKYTSLLETLTEVLIISCM